MKRNWQIILESVIKACPWLSRQKSLKKTLTASFKASPLAFRSFVPVIIYFRGCGEETTEPKHIDWDVIWSVRRQNIYADCCGQSGGQPPLTPRPRAIHTARPRHTVSYLIVRLEMQYLHIVFHTAVTSPEASHTPEKSAHGTERKFEQSFVFFSFKKHKIALTPPLPC